MALSPLPARREVLSVRALTLYVKNLLDTDPVLADVWVRGEISNWRRHTSGHCYFTLKDEHAQVRCVLFRSQAARLRFEPGDGLRVLVRGHVSVFERDGAYQLYVDEIEPDGRGALYLAFEQLKARLEAEGLFDPARKRPLPRLPRKVGIVTSPTGAAIRDMITVARRRFPNVHIVLAPALVQGEEAPRSLVQALDQVVRVPGVDVVIIGRGGGSIEELWAFNEEIVARAIAACPVPVVSAVGHETDFTIADFAADVRAPTPSAAAELVVPSKADLCLALQAAGERLARAARAQVERRRERLRLLASRRVLVHPAARLSDLRQYVDGLGRRLGLAMSAQAGRKRAALQELSGRLDALNPLAVLGRGYAIVLDAAGNVVREARAVGEGDRLELILHRGRLWARAEGSGPDGGES